MFAIACRVHARILNGVGENRDIGFEVEQMPQCALGVSELHRHRDARKFALECGKDFGRVKGADSGETQVPGVQRAVRSQQLVRLLPETHQALGDREQGRTRIGQLDPPAAALEQFDPVGSLELLDLRRDGRLPNAERLGGGREPAMLRNGVEGAQRCEAHCHFQ